MAKGAEFATALKEAYPRLWRFCLSTCGVHDVAQDLAQTTALRALEKQHLFEPGTRLDLWLFRMAQRIWLNDLRAQTVRRGQGLVPIEDAGLEAQTADAISNIYLAEVLSKVMALPEAQRVAVVLVYVEGFTYEEAAQVLDIPAGTIMSRLSAARRKLSTHLSDAKDVSR